MKNLPPPPLSHSPAIGVRPWSCSDGSGCDGLVRGGSPSLQTAVWCLARLGGEGMATPTVTHMSGVHTSGRAGSGGITSQGLRRVFLVTFGSVSPASVAASRGCPQCPASRGAARTEHRGAGRAAAGREGRREGGVRGGGGCSSTMATRRATRPAGARVCREGVWAVCVR